jgi:hypothetical protein
MLQAYHCLFNIAINTLNNKLGEIEKCLYCVSFFCNSRKSVLLRGPPQCSIGCRSCLGRLTFQVAREEIAALHGVSPHNLRHFSAQTVLDEGTNYNDIAFVIVYQAHTRNRGYLWTRPTCSCAIPPRRAVQPLWEVARAGTIGGYHLLLIAVWLRGALIGPTTG